MKYLKYCLVLTSLLPFAAEADALAEWAPHDSLVNWIPLGSAHGTDVYMNFSREGRIADVTIKSGIYDSSRELTQVNLVSGYFGCPEGELPDYLEHAVSTTYDAVTHSPTTPAGARLTGDNVPVTQGSVIESAAKLACADQPSHPSGH